MSHFPTQVRTCSGYKGLKVTTLFSAHNMGSPSDNCILLDYEIKVTRNSEQYNYLIPFLNQLGVVLIQLFY